MASPPNRVFTLWTMPVWIVLVFDAFLIIRRLFGWWSEAEFLSSKQSTVIDFLLSPHGQLIVMVASVGFLFYSSRKKELDPPVTHNAVYWCSKLGWPPSSLRKARRIPYVKVRKLANAKGWELNDDSTPCGNRAYDLEKAMRQAASDGDLLVWGRRYETPLGSNPLISIPKEHFMDDFTFRHGYLTRDNVKNIATYTWKPEIGKNRKSFGLENYCDLYVSYIDIKRLLCCVRPSDGSSGN